MATQRRTFTGRGSTTEVQDRFRTSTVYYEDDYLHSEDASSKTPTIALEEVCKTIISTNDSPDIPFERSINPYRGCEHGCVYCFARPSHAYLNYSPGIDFETKIFFKSNAARIFRTSLENPKYIPQVIAMGTNTDPYQPLETQKRITRSLLQTFLDFGHPVSIVTKSFNIVDDLDLLTQLARKNLVQVALSVTSLDLDLARKLEPRAASPLSRLKAIDILNNAGVPCGVMVSPMIPCLNDAELEDILAASRNRGAVFARTILLRLPHEVKELFVDWLDLHYPLKKEKILAHLKEMREGKLYSSEFGQRMTGTGTYATLLRARFNVAVRKLAFPSSIAPLSLKHFVRSQLSLSLN